MTGSARIAYASGRGGEVELQVFDLRGRRVRSLAQVPSVMGVVNWDGRNDSGQQVPQGQYLVRMRTGSEVVNRKVSVVR